MTDRLTPGLEAAILRLIAPYLVNDMGDVARKDARAWRSRLRNWAGLS